MNFFFDLLRFFFPSSRVTATGMVGTKPVQRETEDIFSGNGNGVLHFCTSDTVDWHESEGFRWLKPGSTRDLNVHVGEDEFDAVYVSLLASIGIKPADTSGHYDWEKFEWNRKKFESEFPEYSMLGAYYDVYQDLAFTKLDIEKLMAECVSIKKKSLSSKADLTIRKLLYVCEQARKDDAYLITASD